MTEPQIPDELWMLWDANRRCFAKARETFGSPLVVFMRERDAEESAMYNSDRYDFKPVRVK